MATNYAFGGGKIGPTVSRLSQGTQDRIAGVNRGFTSPTSELQTMGAAPDDFVAETRSKFADINNFGDQQTQLRLAQANAIGQHKKAAEEAAATAAAKKAREDSLAAQTASNNSRTSAYNSTGGDPNFKYTGPATGQRATLVQSALSLRGEKYAWGGGGPGRRQSHGVPGGPGSNVVGVDCSGLTSYAYSQIGINIPHLARRQLTMGYKTALRNLQPGDLVVWNNGRHTSMYIGNGQIVESVPSTGPRVSRLPTRGVTGVHLRLPGE